MDKDLNIRVRTIKLLGKKHRGNPHDIGLGNALLDMTPGNKRKIDN